MRQIVSKSTVAVLGASGATGRLVVANALEAGHDVVAVVRRAGSFTPTAGLQERIWSDVHDGDALAPALAGADIVISALGGAGSGPTTVCTDAIRTAVPAMVADGIARLIVVSAHGVLESHDGSLYCRAVWSGVGEKMQDKETMEPLIVDSGLDWTIVRPPALRDTPATGKYVVGEEIPIRLWHSIGRADLAAFLVQEAEQAQFVHRYPRIHR
ncbi:NAD(P)-dependent oxidoreductase [Curtobacterium sp. ISL-83]|uniref:NAD(P)-dependent oxidoreductase n=1 Tax=Curtobacterium sp. ISL-83 TaxID=2819145 RepID=UPI001BE58471|nr:NAD(P)H-binding protein [Curtobacterium sp. ISL-83]MBT2503574.1 NAD(P)H-binding protein [Curtobacterium sp. ISL-83]